MNEIPEGGHGTPLEETYIRRSFDDRTISSSNLLLKLISEWHVDINMPPEQWSENQKRHFISIFNNFVEKFPGRHPDNPPIDENEARFWKEVESTFINHNILTEDFKLKIREYRQLVDKGFGKEEQQYYRDLLVWIELKSLPAILDLLDRGYLLSRFR